MLFAACAMISTGCMEWCPTNLPEFMETTTQDIDAREHLDPREPPPILVDSSDRDTAYENSTNVLVRSGGPIRPSKQNPYYWEYRGQSVILLGGTKNDNLFQSDSLEQHLDLLVSVGGNYVRNTMSSRDEGDLWPFYRLPDGRYDLNQFSKAYYDRFETLLRLAFERDIIVQIELWDRFDFAMSYAGGAGWNENPYRPANNINYTTDESGLSNTYDTHPGKNENPFFRSIPAEENNTVLLEYQLAQIDTLLDISLKYPNVLYTMDNETSASAAWGAYWSTHIKQRATRAGVEVYTTEMWGAWDLKDDQHRRTLDHPEIYGFIDISQNNQNEDQDHWDNLQWVRSYTADEPRPLNHVKAYGRDDGSFGTSTDGVERFWRSLLGGGASVRFHRPPNGLGLSKLAQAHIRSARMFVNAFNIMEATPDAQSGLLSDRNADEAYLAYDSGRQYAVYFTDGGSVTLDLCEVQGTFSVRWLDLENSMWQAQQSVEGDGKILLSPPGAGPWVVLLTSLQVADDEEINESPMGHVLEPNYPNPFSSETLIRYALPKRATVRLAVYDAIGRLVREVVNKEQAAGWHEVAFNSSGLPIGVYYYQLKAGVYKAMRQMLVIR